MEQQDLQKRKCDSEYGRPGTGMMNPLLNKLILENLFSHLENAGLLKSRLVCRLWNKEANRFLRMRQLVNFSGSNTKHIYSFLNLMRPYYNNPDKLSEDMIPFGRFSIQIWDSESYRSRFVSLPGYSEAFFNNYGQYVKYLQISFNDFKDTVLDTKYRDWFLGTLSNSLRILELNGQSSFVPTASQRQKEFIFDSNEEVKVLPNLRSLIVTDFFDEPEPESELEDAPGGTTKRFGMRFIFDILRMAPNIQSLTVNTFENVLSSSLTSAAIQALQEFCCCGTSRSRPQQHLLRNLRLQTHINEQHLKQILVCGLQLRSCELKYLDISTSTHALLAEFLASQSRALENLVLGFGNGNENTMTEIKDDFVFAVLANLKCLRSVVLRNCKVSDVGLRYITEKVKLSHLQVTK